jgi:hypothetical protein
VSPLKSLLRISSQEPRDHGEPGAAVRTSNDSTPTSHGSADLDKESIMKKKLSLQRETLQALEGSVTLQVAGGFSGITTCVYCNVTNGPACTSGATGTSGCPR